MAGCGGSSSALPGNAIAVVCGQTVTRAQFDDFMRQGRAEYKLNKQAFPETGTATYKALEQRVVTLLVQHAEQQSAAPGLGVSVTAAQIDAAVAQTVKGQFGGKRGSLVDALVKQGMTMSDLRDSVRSNLLQTKITNALGARVKITSAEIEAYYNAHRSQYKTGRSRLVSAEGKKFVLQEGEMPTADANLAFALPVGKASPRKLSFGSSKIVVTPLGPTRPPAQIPLSRVRVPIAQYLIGQKRDAAVKAWMSGVAARCAKTARYASGFKPS